MSRVFSSTLNSSTYQHSKKLAIVIYAYHRSGSTFTGEILNHHPHIFYLYEPMRFGSVYFEKKKNKRNTKIVDFLSNIYECKFDEMQKFTDNLNNNKKGRHVTISVPVAEALGCKNHINSGRLFKCPDTEGNVPSSLLAQLCKSRTVAIKLIRAVLKTHIVPLAKKLTNSGFDVKVIHLLRDPRGHVSSLLSLTGKDRLSKNNIQMHAREQCDRMLHDVNTGTSIFHENEYFLLKYEDLAQNSLSTSKKLYKFLGLELTESVKNYIQANTGISQHVPTKKMVEDTYSSYRANSTATSISWRKTLTANQINMIQKECKKLMDLAGYQLLE